MNDNIQYKCEYFPSLDTYIEKEGDVTASFLLFTRKQSVIQKHVCSYITTAYNSEKHVKCVSHYL